MFFRWSCLHLILERLKESHDPFPGLSRGNNLVNDPQLGRKIGIVELLLIGPNQFGSLGRRVVGT